MTDNVTQFPTPDIRDPLVGPFTENRVVVDGRAIPLMTGWHEGDMTWLSIDRRFAIGVPKELAHQVAWFAANALAIGQGYPSMNATSKEQPFAPQVQYLDSVP